MKKNEAKRRETYEGTFKNNKKKKNKENKKKE